MERYLEDSVSSESPSVDEGTADSTEEAFMRGYMDEDDGEECAECGEALRDAIVAKELEGELQRFCSQICSEDFEESM